VRTPDRKLTAVAVTAALIGFATVPAFATAPAFADIVPPLPLPSSASPAPPAPSAVPPVPAPAVPKAPALPAVPALPKLPALPQVPALPKLPVAPQLPKLPAAAIPKVLPPAQAPAKPAAAGVGQLGGLPFGSFHDHVPAVALQQFGPPAPNGQHLGPDMPYDQTGHNTTAKGVDVDTATRAYEAALQHARPSSSSALPGLLALALALGGGTAAVLVYRRRRPSAVGAGQPSA